MTDLDTTVWLRAWLPSTRLAADDQERARTLRQGLAMLDDWNRAIGQLHGEWLQALAALDGDEEDAAP